MIIINDPPNEHGKKIAKWNKYEHSVFVVMNLMTTMS